MMLTLYKSMMELMSLMETTMQINLQNQNMVINSLARGLTWYFSRTRLRRNEFSILQILYPVSKFLLEKIPVGLINHNNTNIVVVPVVPLPISEVLNFLHWWLVCFMDYAGNRTMELFQFYYILITFWNVYPSYCTSMLCKGIEITLAISASSMPFVCIHGHGIFIYLISGFLLHRVIINLLVH